MGKNVTVYVSDGTWAELIFVRVEDDLGPTEIFARAVQREARRIRKLRQRQVASGAVSGNAAPPTPTGAGVTPFAPAPASSRDGDPAAGRPSSVGLPSREEAL
mgnify:CR=1 FL=1